MDYQVVLSPSARADLRDIVRYISFDALDRALQFGLFLISRIRLLAQNPKVSRIVPEFEDKFIREIVVPSYRVCLPCRRFEPSDRSDSILARHPRHARNIQVTGRLISVR